MKKLLLVAYHFPPYSGGSGVHRATKFARFLLDHGWRTHVLTTSSRAYERLGKDSGTGVPATIPVTRAFALDAQRHLGIRGRFLSFTAIPDRWVSWVIGAVPAGLVALYRERIDLILVTYPIATAVLIGLVLHRLTGKPLVVDFRDSMTDESYPRDPRLRRVYLWIEKAAIKHGSRFLFTTPSTRQMYLDRYPDLLPGNCALVSNGYDEEDFADIPVTGKPSATAAEGSVRLVHAGVIYQDDRDPTAFFGAVRKLKGQGIISAANLRIDLRASGSEEHYAGLLREYGIEDLIHLLPGLPHRQALSDTATADGLLLFQAASCDHQIPAKVYEYLRLRKPILALTSMSGDTAALLKTTGGATIADLADEQSIFSGLSQFVAQVRLAAHPLPNWEKTRTLTRRNGASELASCLDQLMPSEVTADSQTLRSSV